MLHKTLASPRLFVIVSRLVPRFVVHCFLSSGDLQAEFLGLLDLNGLLAALSDLRFDLSEGLLKALQISLKEL